MKKQIKRKRDRRGQTIVEYVLIICIVVVASVGILGLFSDTVRAKIAGIISTIDNNADVDDKVDTSSEEIMKDLDKDGYDNE